MQSLSNLGKIFETAATDSLLAFIRDQYLALLTAETENLASHKYDVAKGITIRSVFFRQSWIFVIQLDPKTCRIS